MSQNKFSRRDFLKFGGGALAAAAGAYLAPRAVTAAAGVLRAAQASAAPAAATPLDQRYHLAVTDGWVHLPEISSGTTFHPDPWAEAPFNVYTFGFRNMTGLSDDVIRGQKGKVQLRNEN